MRIFIQYQTNSVVPLLTQTLPCVLQGEEPVVYDLISAFQARPGSLLANTDSGLITLHLPDGLNRSALSEECFANVEDTALDPGCLLSSLDSLELNSKKPLIIKSMKSIQQEKYEPLKQQSVAPKNPKEALRLLLDFDVETLTPKYTRPSVTSKDKPTEEITYIAPLMKFVNRKVPAAALFRSLDEYLDWKSKKLGELEKNIKFITVVGTSGKGKTTFSRRFLDLHYIGKHSAIIDDCRASNRRYRVSCTSFDINRNAETQLSLMILYEAFKYSSRTNSLQDYITLSHHNVHKLLLADVLKLITETFYVRSDIAITERLVIINLDETNALLKNDLTKHFFQELLLLLRMAAEGLCLITILSGTHSVDQFELVQISQCMFVDIDLPLIHLEASQEVILEMCSDPKKYTISPYLKYLLTLCGGVGRYLEFAIIQMSIMGGAKTGFKQDCYEKFLNSMQTSQHIESLLNKVTTSVLAHYPKVFLKFSELIDLLSCYTLFQWTVQRKTMINFISVGDLEKEGLVFLQPIPSHTDCYLCIIPFITMYWAITYSSNTICIPFLKHLKSYFSPEESENNSLHIIMMKLWGLSKKNGLIPDASGRCTVMLSDLFPLRDEQRDMKIKFHNSLEIMNAGQQINMSNYKNFKKDDQCVGYLNAKGASFTDVVIFSEPIIGIQEKQSVVAKQQNLKELVIPSFSDESFQEERNKFPVDGIFVLISDDKQGEIVLGQKDIFIDYENFEKFAGPLIALRKLYCINELNPKFKKLKIK